MCAQFRQHPPIDLSSRCEVPLIVRYSVSRDIGFTQHAADFLLRKSFSLDLVQPRQIRSGEIT